MQANLWLPIFKQGDDLAHCLENEKDNFKAMNAYADHLEIAASMLRSVAEKIKDKPVEIDAGTHMIMLSGPDEVLLPLIEEELLSPDPFEDEDEEEEYLENGK